LSKNYVKFVYRDLPVKGRVDFSSEMEITSPFNHCSVRVISHPVKVFEKGCGLRTVARVQI